MEKDNAGAQHAVWESERPDAGVQSLCPVPVVSGPKGQSASCQQLQLAKLWIGSLSLVFPA
jgi:hypothetical protein